MAGAYLSIRTNGKSTRHPKKGAKGSNSQDVGSKDRNDSGHRGSITGSHATTFNEKKFKENSVEFKRRNHPGNRTMWDVPHSPENIINST